MNCNNLNSPFGGQSTISLSFAPEGLWWIGDHEGFYSLSFSVIPQIKKVCNSIYEKLNFTVIRTDLDG